MRALVGHPMNVTPYDIVSLERLRAASRTTRRLTQGDYESQGLSYQAQLERDAVATTESDSDSVSSWEWGQDSHIRNTTESDDTESDDTESDTTESDATESDATESDSDESFGPGWVWNQRARALGDLTNDQRYY